MTRSMIGTCLKTGSWELHHPKVYVQAGMNNKWLTRVSAAALGCGLGSAASHRSAARLLGFDGFEGQIVEVTTPKYVRWSGVVVHRGALADSDIRMVKGIPTTTPAATLCALGSVVDDSRVEAALDSALVQGLVTVDYLARRLERAGRRWGTSFLKSLLDERAKQGPLESELERMYHRNVTMRHGLPVPQFQFEVPNSSPPRRIDFAYPHLMLGVEVLGWKEHGKRTTWQRDWNRHNQLSNLGWEILYYTWTDVTKHPERVAREVAAAISRRTLSLFDR